MSIKINAKDFYRVFENSSRNNVQIYKDDAYIYLTKGSVATINPDEAQGIAEILVTGLGSPLKISFEKQNMIFKINYDTSPEPAETATPTETLEPGEITETVEPPPLPGEQPVEPRLGPDEPVEKTPSDKF